MPTLEDYKTSFSFFDFCKMYCERCNHIYFHSQNLLDKYKEGKQEK